MATRELLPRTASRSTKLIAASERLTLDPFTEVDWTLPIDDRAYHLPPEWLPLFETEAWDAMGPEERIAYSRHEGAALCGAGIWFENRLMQVVIRHLTEVPIDSPIHRYLLTEVADECRHSMMFGEYVRRAGTPAYGPPPETPSLELLEDVPGHRALEFLLILAIEELLDAANRASMNDQRLHPIIRQIARVHVMEEARHLSFAKTYLTETWPTLDEEERTAVRELAPLAAGLVADLTVNPQVYEELGIEGGELVARTNPHHRSRVIDGLAKVTAFLTELGVIGPDERPAWSELGLIA